MKLPEMKTNLLDMHEAEMFQFFEAYWNIRGKDLLTVLTKVKVEKEPGKRAKEKQISVNPAQLAMLRKLGLI